MITNNPGHLKGFSYVGLHRYSLTFCTEGRRRLFTDAAAVDLVVQQLLRAANEQKFAVIAYCFMPDHLHLLIEGRSDDSDGRRFIRAHVLRDDEATVEVVKYIVANPVRTGLASTVEDYPFVGSLVYQLKDLINSTSG